MNKRMKDILISELNTNIRFCKQMQDDINDIKKSQEAILKRIRGEL
jgi:hypothetical protein